MWACEDGIAFALSDGCPLSMVGEAWRSGDAAVLESNDDFESQRDCCGWPGIGCRENGSWRRALLPWGADGGLRRVIARDDGRKGRGMRYPEVCGKPCFCGVSVGQHSELLWPDDLTDWIAHSRVSPGGERYGLGYVQVGSACYYPRARRGGQRPPANVL
jgi:hypothetical protein